MEINFAIDFKIIFVASYIVNTEFIFEYFYDNGINLPSYLPTCQQARGSNYIFVWHEGVHIPHDGTPKKSSFVLFVFVLFIFKKYTKEKGKVS